MSSVVRAILDTISEEDEKALNEMASDPNEGELVPVDNDEDDEKMHIEEVRVKAPPANDLDRLLDMKAFHSVRIEEAMDYLGQYYFNARADTLGLWAPTDTINWIDAVWLRSAHHIAKHYSGGNTTRIMNRERLTTGVLQCLAISACGVEMLRHSDLALMAERLRTFWLSLSQIPKQQDMTDTVRLCTRFVSAVAYVRTHVIGDRKVRELIRTPEQDRAYTAALDAMLAKYAKTMPEQVHDAMQQVITTCMMPIDAATTYKMTSINMGIYKGNAQDPDTVAAQCEELDPKLVTELCEFVPWDRPNQPAKVLTKEQRWLWETWQLHVFSFMFHSAHCGESGSWASSSENVLDAGLFSTRYLLTWWHIMQPQGLKRLQYQKRFFVTCLPLLLQMGNQSWWVRTKRDLWVCSSLGSALAQWLEVVADDFDGRMEDTVPVSVESFCPGLHTSRLASAVRREHELQPEQIIFNP
jgi:hypothetical protein